MNSSNNDYWVWDLLTTIGDPPWGIVVLVVLVVLFRKKTQLCFVRFPGFPGPTGGFPGPPWSVLRRFREGWRRLEKVEEG